MVDYSRSQIYKIVSNNLDKVYVGATTCGLDRRFKAHIRDYELYKKGRITKYTSSYDILSSGDYRIICLENVSCESKIELHKKEREWIEKLECVNRVLPTRTKYEYNRTEKCRKKNRERKQCEEYKKRDKEYRKKKIDCVCGSSIGVCDYARHKRSKNHIKFMELTEPSL